MAKQSKSQVKRKATHRAKKAPKCPLCGRRTKRGRKCQFQGGGE